MSMLLTKRWEEEMKRNLPVCPACEGQMEYGYLVGKDSIHWANEIQENHFSGIEDAMTWAPKKPLGIPMARCPSCRIMITIYPE